MKPLAVAVALVGFIALVATGQAFVTDSWGLWWKLFLWDSLVLTAVVTILLLLLYGLGDL